MYTTEKLAYNDSAAQRSAGVDFGQKSDSTPNYSTDYSDYNNYNYNYNQHSAADSAFQKSYPAEWGMQFQGNTYSNGNGHQRNVSDSTINSTGPSSPAPSSFSFAQQYSNPYIVSNKNNNVENSPASFEHFFKQTATSQDPFQAYSSVGYMPSALSHTPAVHIDMKHMAMDQHKAAADEMPDFSHSSRQSVSSRGQDSPSTPPTDDVKAEDALLGADDEQEQRPGLYKIASNDYRSNPPRVELFRTESAAAADELYNPDFSQPTAPSSSTHLQTQPTDANYLSPRRTLVQDRIRTANNCRSQSPQQTSSSSSSKRDKSPFRPGSPLAPQDGSKADDFKSPSAFFASAADARRQQIEEASAREVDRHYKPSLHREPTKTMSPRDALLDYNDADAAGDMPLFPDALPVGYSNHVGVSDFFTSNYINGAGQGLGHQSQQQQQQMPTNMGAFRPQPNTNNATDLSNFLPPQQRPQQQQLPQQHQPRQQQQQQPAAPAQIPANPFTAPQYRPATGFLSGEPTPDFPAHLASMESSISDVPISSQESAASDVMMQRPQDTSAATGGYTCTFHNCTLRFDTPAKLQKHKRDVHHTNHHHREVSTSLSSAPPTTASHSANPSLSPDPSHDGSEGSVGSVGSGMTSAALAARNSQSGPHKCTRINPSTGKPCNTIFSRPYDLTRHEDTIHNRQKVKVRCQYCREEKTFSRNDALTRHMRVVHPDVQWDVKRGARGGSVRGDF